MKKLHCRPEDVMGDGWKVSQAMGGGWEWLFFKIPSNPGQSVVLGCSRAENKHKHAVPPTNSYPAVFVGLQIFSSAGAVQKTALPKPKTLTTFETYGILFHLLEMIQLLKCF